MAELVLMPKQGNTVESCIITNWIVKEGDLLNPDTAICEVETDKANFEIPAGFEGYLLKILHQEGEDVPVMQAIAVIGKKNEDWQEAIKKSSLPIVKSKIGEKSELNKNESRNAKQENLSSQNQIETEKNTSEEVGFKLSLSPRAKTLARAEGLNISEIKRDQLLGSGPNNRIIEDDIKRLVRSGPGFTKLAKEKFAGLSNIILSDLSEGSALASRLNLFDLSALSVDLQKTSKVKENLLDKIGQGSKIDFKGSDSIVSSLKSVRKVISQRMKQSLNETAQVSYHAAYSAEKLLAFRNYFKSGQAQKELESITIGDMLMFCVSRVLNFFPEANATLENNEYKIFKNINLAFAVDTARGLLVPVIKNSQQLSLVEMSIEIKRLALACQNSKIKPEELEGGTFTVSNLGSFGIEYFTPILNYPQVAILGVSSISKRLSAAGDNAFKFENMISLSLTANHEVIDGAPASKLLRAFGYAIASIDELVKI